ncbi:ATP-binding protein [Haliea sp. E1-2-M8]|uniref:ATP-binding protein n=1 Tax=Haliea sp. E1-2-M8 TaxID=3064706 RepID=UPI002722F840|nr:ATP-binding protein [Haliea sp. E1-2-M8]MDO8863109.1 ATP-binding protein [Haliea sp. E1-2-M8]
MGTYIVCGLLWILFSDAILAMLVQDPAVLVQVSVYKGFAFVGTTALVLYLVTRRSFATVEKGFSRLRAHKREIERFNRLYQAFSRINHEVLTAADKEQLFSRICQVLVEQGGFQMAWVGWLGSDASSLEPVATAGEGVEAVIRDLMDKSEVNMGSVGWQQVVDDAAPVICNDFSASEDMRRWRDVARQHGLRSRAALPLVERGEVVAVLSVYAGEVNFFRDNEVSLLQEVVVDVSLALDGFVLAEEHRQAESAVARELSFSQAMMDSMPGILYFYDEKGHFLRWNRNFETVSGYSGDEVARMLPVDFFAADDRGLLQQRIEEALHEGEATIEAEFLSRDGRRTPYFFTGRGVDFDGARCLVGVGIDITERKRAEIALRDLNDTLEHRVAERTSELASALVRAEAADRIKSAFLATMSHELRTPLNSIIGFTGIILQELAGPLNEEQHRQLKMVQGSARHLLELINDVLDLSKIEAGQLEVRAETFDLGESIDRVVASIAPLAEKKNLRVLVRADPPLPAMVGDRRRVEQILINLLNNAIKFTDSGEVSLVVEPLEDYFSPAAQERCSAVCMRVRDTGVGIRREDLSRLFLPFSQLDYGLTRQHEGTGLGLMICRRLVDLMGGEITARSEWTKGSEFTVVLPTTIQVAR